ncbi:hypothetical protein J4405_05795 [Candidatus Woesearchaeota archaeon]|nr:hypothetical protein [Candidatus Woesearchaeota archaeon]
MPENDVVVLGVCANAAFTGKIMPVSYSRLVIWDKSRKDNGYFYTQYNSRELDPIDIKRELEIAEDRRKLDSSGGFGVRSSDFLGSKALASDEEQLRYSGGEFVSLRRAKTFFWLRNPEGYIQGHKGLYVRKDIYEKLKKLVGEDFNELNFQEELYGREVVIWIAEENFIDSQVHKWYELGIAQIDRMIKRYLMGEGKDVNSIREILGLCFTDHPDEKQQIALREIVLSQEPITLDTLRKTRFWGESNPIDSLEQLTRRVDIFKDSLMS